MTNSTNLNQFRKAKARAVKEKRAAENRVKFGQTKAEKKKLKTEQDKAAKTIDGHKRNREDPKT